MESHPDPVKRPHKEMMMTTTLSHDRFKSSQKLVRFLSFPFFVVNISSFQKNCVRATAWKLFRNQNASQVHTQCLSKIQLNSPTKLNVLCKTSLIPYSSAIPHSFFNVCNFKSLIHHLVFNIKFGGYTYMNIYSIHCVCDLSGFQWSTIFQCLQPFMIYSFLIIYVAPVRTK